MPLGIFPGQGRVTWRDWYTHEVVDAAISTNTTLDAPLGHIPLHIRDGSAILMHAQPAYTIEETRQGPYALLVSQAADGYAFGTAYVDDGETVPPTPNTTLMITARTGGISLYPSGNFHISEPLSNVTVLGVGKHAPGAVSINDEQVIGWNFDTALERLTIGGLNVDLSHSVEISWQ